TIAPGPGSGGTTTGASALPGAAGATAPSGNAALGAGVTSSTASAAAAPVSAELPGGYGFSSQTLTAGQGRFALPPLRFSVTISNGYDDNILSTPSNPVPQVIQVVKTRQENVLVREQVGTRFVLPFGLQPIFRFRTVTVR